MTMASWVFSISLAGLAYFLFGYPLLLRVLPVRNRKVLKSHGFTPNVTVLMAVYNGASFLEPRLDNLLALDYPADRVEVIVISDGSTDETAAIAARYAEKGVRLLQVVRGGKAAALNAGLAQASGEVLLMCDVRQRFHPMALRELAANFADPQVGVVTGELRILKPDGAVGEQADMDLYWRYELWVRSIHSRIWSLFNTTGCIYAMRRQLAQPLPAGTLGDDAALPLLAYRAGHRIVFEPAAIAWDYPTQSGAEFRRRMRTLSGAWQVWARHPRLLLLPHRMWLHFFSHKFGRLLMPWLLVAMLVASLFLPAGPWKWLILVGELLFLSAAALEPSVPAGFPARRFFSLCRTFLVMNLAALLSVQVFFTSPQKLWGIPTRVDRMDLPKN